MSPQRRGLTVLLVHLLLLAAVLGRYAADRRALPQAWARTMAIDPVDVLRGRYVRLWLDLPDRRPAADTLAPVECFVEGEHLAVREARGWPGLPLRRPAPDGARGVVLQQPLAFFISEHEPDPSLHPPGQVLWVLVSVPPRGMPRPIRVELRPDDALPP